MIKTYVIRFNIVLSIAQQLVCLVIIQLKLIVHDLLCSGLNEPDLVCILN